MKKNQICLTKVQRQELERFSKTGVHSARLITRAKIILALDVSERKKAVKQTEIAHQLGISRQTINKTRLNFQAAESVSAFVQRKKRETPPVEPKVTGEMEARIIALACSAVPQGYARWTLRLLADKSVELQYADSLSHMTVSRLLKKHCLSLT
jgi:predicted XRE-type DNA-binding protein